MEEKRDKKEKNTKRRRRRLRRFIIIFVIFILCLAVLYYLWSLDAQPMQSDYTIKDLRSAHTDCNPSWELLLRLGDEENTSNPNISDTMQMDLPVDGNPAIPVHIEIPSGFLYQSKSAPVLGLTRVDVEQIDKTYDQLDFENLVHTSQFEFEEPNAIDTAWDHALKARNIIKELSRYPEIADLSDPNDWEETPSYLENIRILGRLYILHGILEIQRGNYREAVEHIIQFDITIRNLSITARPILTKLVCFDLLHVDIEIANYLVNDRNLPEPMLHLLADHYEPFSLDILSTESSMRFDYLRSKMALYTLKAVNRLYKLNSTLWLFRSLYFQNTKLLSNVWPDIYPDSWPVVISMESGRIKFSQRYKIYNPVGYAFCNIMLPALERFQKNADRLKYKDQVFQLIMRKRIDPNFDIKTVAKQDNIVIDIISQRIFSHPSYIDESIKVEGIYLPLDIKVLGIKFDE